MNIRLSIIIPAFNEEKTVGHILKKVYKVSLKNIEKEIIIINDGSTDNTEKIIKDFLFCHSREGGNPVQSKHKKIRLISHKKNQGKGKAIKTGLNLATGDYILIQDADLEYDPQQYQNLLTPILENKAKVVYGTRLKRLPNLKRDENNIRFFFHYLGNKALSLLTSILYKQWITDMETGYKIFPKNVIKNIRLDSKGFEFEPEITAKLLKKGLKIYEVPIITTPRSYKEGKKLNTFKDGIKALKTLIKYRFTK
jgi:glycosyltransferase involved in cell wall biosynthesis